MIWLSLGLALWGLALLLLIRLAQLVIRDVPRTRTRWIVWALLLAASLILLLRPHEDIFGGQDTGAYINAAAVVGRQHTLSYEDPMLSQLTPKEREPFIIRKWYPAKYHCLRLDETDTARMKPWFPPAFSLMAGVIAWLFGPKAILYVVPLFGILAGLTIAAIARRLIKHRWSGEIAFWLYITLPLLVWHARFPRPEVIATYFVWGGFALLLETWLAGRWKQPWTLILGALCMTVAPFMHMMSAAILLPAILLVILAILTGRNDYLLFLLIGTGMFALLILQAQYVCDTYHILRYIGPILLQHLPLFSLLSMATLIILTVVSTIIAKYRAKNRPVDTPTPRTARWTGPLLAVALPIAYLIGYALATHADPAELKQGITALIHRTDFNVVANMLSRSLCLLGLLGLIALTTLQRSRLIPRIAFLVCVVPATFVIGNIYDFFMSRYLLLSIVPLLIISLTALVTLIPQKRKYSYPALLLAVVIVTGFALRHRTTLIRLREFKGFAGYIENIAEEINQKHGMALIEYSQIAAPFDLMYGVPTLSLEPARVFNYRPAEKAWRKLMEKHPDQPAYFITPYAREPASPFFRFRLVSEFYYKGKEIIARRWELPTETGTSAFHLRMYEMTLPNTGKKNSDAVLPYSTSFGQGNIGLRRFENPKRADRVQVAGVEVGPFNPLTIKIPPDIRKEKGQLWMVVITPDNSDDKPTWKIEIGTHEIAGTWTRMAHSWWLYRSDNNIALRKTETIRINASHRLMVVMGRLVSTHAINTLFDGWNAERQTQEFVPPFESRWAHNGARIMYPITRAGDEPRYMLAFFVTPNEYGETAEITFGRYSLPAMAQTVPTGQFIWGLWPLGPRKKFGAAECVFLRNASCTKKMTAEWTDIAVGIGEMVIVKGQKP